MKTISWASALAVVAAVLVASPLFAASIAYPFRITDNSGSLVAGATVKVGSTTLTSNVVPVSSATTTTVGTTAGEYVLGTGAVPGGSLTVTLIDFGTGDYDLIYDPTSQGEMYFPLAVTKSGSVITGTNGTLALIATKDSSYIQTALPNAAPAASGGIPTVGTSTGQITPDGSGNVYVSSGTGTGQVSLSSGEVLLQATQTGVTIPTVTAVGSVSGAVGSVTGAVGSVTGGVTVASGSITSISTADATAVGQRTADGLVTFDGALAMLISYLEGVGANSYNAGTLTLTSTYKRQDGSTTAYTHTTVLNSGSSAPTPASAAGSLGTLPN